MEEGPARQRTLLLQEAEVSAEVTDYILTKLNCESLSDFAALFDQSAYRDPVRDVMSTKVRSAKDTLIQLRRVRSSAVPTSPPLFGARSSGG